LLTESSKKALKADDIPLGDCIQADIDNEGNFNGFSIRTEIAKVVYGRDAGKLDFIYKIIKTVNHMNRLRLEGNKDYILGSKKVEAEQRD